MTTMPYPNVTSLYKYRTINDETLERLRSGDMWVPQPHTFNDPFDCSVDNCKEINLDKTTLDVISRSGFPKIRDFDLKDVEKKGQLNNVLYDTFLELVMTCGVMSLTENCESVLMWSHYADSHKGFCMEFERNDSCLLGNYSVTNPVNYSRLCPTIDLTNLWKENETLFSLEWVKMAFTKSEEWSYEREWRVCYMPGNHLAEYPGKLKSIIWCYRTEDKDKELVRDSLINSPSVVFKQARRVHREFKIAIDVAWEERNRQS